MLRTPPPLDALISEAGLLAHRMVNAHAGTPAALKFDTIARNVARLLDALREGPAGALPVADALCGAWGPNAEPPTGSDEERLSRMLDEVRSAVLAWTREQLPPLSSIYFPIDPSHPTPRGPDISYECLKCGDVIPSIEEAKGPWHCRCYAIALDFDMHRASFRDAVTARGVRTINPKTPARAIEERGETEGADLTSTVARRASVTLTTRGGLLLVDFMDAPAFLDACAAEGVRVLGIEGFRVGDDGVTPDMEAIADFTMPPGPGSVEDSIRASRIYLRAVKPDLMFEFALDRPSPSRAT